MNLVDSHCHIQSIGSKTGEANTKKHWAKSGFTVDGVIDRAKKQGVSKLICVGCDLEDSQLAINFVSDRQNVWASIGLHPHEAKNYVDKPDLVEAFKALVNQPKVIAIGECGLDFFYNHSSSNDQLDILKLQLDLASKHNLPVIFHVRQAFTAFWPILDQFKGIKGVLHSYTDDQANLDKALARGLYIGVNGISTFTKEQNQLNMYKQIPLDRLLLETDSPFLTPVPYRGTINEPSRVATVAAFMADLRGENLDDLAKITTSNAQNLFKI